MLTEALIVAGASGLLGLLMAFWLISLVDSVIPATLIERSLNPLDLDLRASVWTLAVSFAAGGFASLLPAFGSTGGHLVAPLKKDQVRSESTSLDAGSALTAVETALAVVLVVAAGLWRSA